MTKISYQSMLKNQQLSSFTSEDSDRAFRDEERVKSLDVAREAVLKLMLDGQEHTLEELRAVGGSSGDRRLRELATPKFGEYVYEKARISGTDSFLYKFVGQRVRTGEQVEFVKLKAAVVLIGEGV